MFILIAFVPMTALSLRTSACEMWAPQAITVKWNDGEDIVNNQWFYDNTVSCDDASFQVIIICRLFKCLICVHSCYVKDVHYFTTVKSFVDI